MDRALRLVAAVWQDAAVAVGVWRERTFWLLLAVVAAGYFTRLELLPIRGEESRWGQIAREMEQTGDWIVPRQQKEPFYSRPPLGSWLIAALWRLTGRLDALAIRLPSGLAILGTSLVVYGYARNYLAPLGAFTSAAAFATMGQTLELGRRGETDALFTFFVCAALLLWHRGCMRGGPATASWCVGYSLAALATLAKGLHGAALFVAPVGAYLLYSRNLRWLCTRGHVTGAAVFLAVVLAWLFPFAGRVGWPGVLRIAFGDVLMRFEDRSLGTLFGHLATYPSSVWGAMLPWSVWLFAYGNRGLRASVAPMRPWWAFQVVCLVVAFLPCWIAPGARGRYFLPMFPFVGLLVGLAIEQSATFGTLRLRDWRLFATGMAVAMVLAGLGGVILALGRIFAPEWPGPPLATALVMMGLAVLLAAVTWRVRRAEPPPEQKLGAETTSSATGGGSVPGGVAATAFFLAAFYATVVTATLAYRGENMRQNVARLKEGLPPDVQLVSLGPVHHLFSFHYEEPIRLVDWPDGGEGDSAFEYFCFHRSRGQTIELPFAWEEMAVLSCDRVVSENPREVVVVGRRRSTGK